MLVLKANALLPSLKNHIINAIVANLKEIIEENKKNNKNKDYSFKNFNFYNDKRF